MRIIWLAFLASLMILSLTTYFAAGGPALPTTEELNRGPLPLVAVVAFAMAFVVPGLLTKSFKNSLKGRAPTGLEMGRSYITGHIVRMALFEASTMIGFVLSMQVQRNVVMPFALASFVGFVLSYPSEEKIRASFQ